jgi:hypothetical protein
MADHKADLLVSRVHQSVCVDGILHVGNFHRVLAGIHKTVNDAGFSEVDLDLGNVVRVEMAAVLPLCAQVRALADAGIEVTLTLPSDAKSARLFTNANWAHLLSPSQFGESHFAGRGHLPATGYSSPSEQHKIVNRIVNTLLGSIPDLTRDQFAALEWTINEITDNVLVHAQSRTGGIVQVTRRQKTRTEVEVVVADAGQGIPMTLGQRFPQMSDTEVLEQAIREGVTRDPTSCQGNGLYGTYQVCSHCNGFFLIDSGHARLRYTPDTGLHVRSETVPYSGTLVVARIDLTDPDLLKEALQFGGKPYVPVDYIETHFETSKPEEFRFDLCSEGESFGSRLAAIPVRIKLANLVRMSGNSRIVIDFAGVSVVSSSFADEVFGKLAADLGLLRFSQKMDFRNVSSTVEQIMNRSITLRVTSSR